MLPMARHLSEMITGTKCEIFPSISSVDKSSELNKWLVFGGIGKNIVKVLDPMTDLWGERYIYLHLLVDVYGFHVGKCIGKYTSPMGPIGMGKDWMGSQVPGAT